MGLGDFLMSWVAVSAGARIISTHLAAHSGYWLGPQLGLSARTPACGLATWFGFPHSMMAGFKHEYPQNTRQRLGSFL